MLVLPENVCHVGNELEFVADKRIRSALLAQEGNPLVRHHNRAQPHRRLAQVRNLNVGFKGAYAARLVLPHDKLQVKGARRQHEAGIVLHVLRAHLLALVHRELHRVAKMPDRHLPALAHFANDVDRGVVLVFFRNEGYLRAGNHQRSVVS